MKIKILVAAHKRFPMPTDRQLYLPILVGAAMNSEVGTNYQRDDSGPNISKKNPNYNELTAVYWAWKNLDAEVVGLVHYRRIFSTKKGRTLKNALNTQEIKRLLIKAPIILPRKRHYYIETNYSHYVHAHEKEPLNQLKEVLIEQGNSRYVDAYDKVMKKRSAHMFNMFIMKRSYFDDYCSWLFKILFQLENRVDISKYEGQEKRVFGFVSELMMDIWIVANNYEYEDTNWLFIGKSHFLKKIIIFMMRKFGFKKQTHF